uniref:Uncharacterized protein n=1 Tax=Physcomitrium patens TaxID=3218 RepID=A0A2K1J8N1_PHYPA|nr:hypothetical protein PHYPA_020991 [Physcomitrium patens]
MRFEARPRDVENQIRLPTIKKKNRLQQWIVKDESLNPTAALQEQSTATTDHKETKTEHIVDADLAAELDYFWLQACRECSQHQEQRHCRPVSGKPTTIPTLMNSKKHSQKITP